MLSKEKKERRNPLRFQGKLMILALAELRRAAGGLEAVLKQGQAPMRVSRPEGRPSAVQADIDIKIAAVFTSRCKNIRYEVFVRQKNTPVYWIPLAIVFLPRNPNGGGRVAHYAICRLYAAAS